MLLFFVCLLEWENILDEYQSGFHKIIISYIRNSFNTELAILVPTVQGLKYEIVFYILYVGNMAALIESYFFAPWRFVLQ